MSEADLIERLAAAVAEKVAPAIPFGSGLWDTSAIAAYLRREPGSVRDNITPLPCFPKAIRLPSAKRRGQPLYEAAEVIAWARSYKEKN
jgi:hypothetical protein